MAAQDPVARQLWLDVERPIQPHPRALVDVPRRHRGRADPVVGQMELRMAPPDRRAAAVIVPVPALPVMVVPEPAVPRPPFGAWLLDQGKRPGSLGELAKAARLDRSFPKRGTADDVRRRFGEAGADGDAFEALDDAEREYARATS